MNPEIEIENSDAYKFSQMQSYYSIYFKLKGADLIRFLFLSFLFFIESFLIVFFFSFFLVYLVVIKLPLVSLKL